MTNHIRNKVIIVTGAARHRGCDLSGHHSTDPRTRRPTTGAAAIQHYQQCGNGSLKLRNCRDQQTRLEDQ